MVWQLTKYIKISPLPQNVIDKNLHAVRLTDFISSGSFLDIRLIIQPGTYLCVKTSQNDVNNINSCVAQRSFRVLVYGEYSECHVCCTTSMQQSDAMQPTICTDDISKCQNQQYGDSRDKDKAQKT